MQEIQNTGVAQPAAPTPTTNVGDLSLGNFNTIAQIRDLVAGDLVTGDKIFNQQILLYTGSSDVLDDQSRFSLEQSYRSEIAARYAVWRTRYAALPMQTIIEAQPRATYSHEREELTFEAIKRDLTSEPSAITPRNETFTDLWKQLEKDGDLLLLGPPGGGKSTALWRLALDLADAGLRSAPDTPLPIFVRLGGIKPNQSLLDFAREELESAVYSIGNRHIRLKSHQVLAKCLHTLLNEGRVVLLWDGLNEVPRTAFADIVTQLSMFLSKYGAGNEPCVHNIITCRVDDYDALIEASGHHDPLACPHVIIKGLDEETIKQLVVGVLGIEKGQTLLNALAEHEQRTLAALARTPLLLTILCGVYDSTNALPSNRGRLIREFVEQRWKREELRQADGWLAVEVQDRALSRLAYAITESGGRGTSVSWDWARRHLTVGGGASPEQLRELACQTDILEELHDGRMVRFSHQLIQEYFAAHALQPRLARAMRLSQSPITRWYRQWMLRNYVIAGKRTGWEETLLLLAGIEGQDGHARERVRTFLSLPLVAARLLLASGDDADIALLDEVCEALAKSLAGQQYSFRERLEICRILARYGDPRLGVGAIKPDWCAVPSGACQIGSPPEEPAALPNEGPLHQLNLPPYYIARYPVTNAQWRQFMEDGGYTKLDWWGDSWAIRQQQGWTQPRYWDDARFNAPNQPVVGVTWFEAVAYTRWLSLQLDYQVTLPSEAEWEKSARGGDSRIYPWGNRWEAGRANTAEAGVGTATPVGCYAAGIGPYGTHDMGGNVFEWTATPWFDSYDSQNDGAARDLAGAPRYAVRGGAWESGRGAARCAFRAWADPMYRDSNLGLRLIAAAISPATPTTAAPGATTFDLVRWRELVRQRIIAFALSPHAALEQSGARSVAGFLIGCTIPPLTGAFTANQSSATNTLFSMLGNAGADLIPGLAKGKYNDSNAIATAEEEAGSAALGEVYRKIAIQLAVFYEAEQALTQAGQLNILAQLRTEVKQREQAAPATSPASPLPAIPGPAQGNTISFGTGAAIDAIGDVVAGDKIGGDTIAGDKIDAQGSQGFVNRPTDTVNQAFGMQHNASTDGADLPSASGATLRLRIDDPSGAIVAAIKQGQELVLRLAVDEDSSPTRIDAKIEEITSGDATPPSPIK